MDGLIGLSVTDSSITPSIVIVEEGQQPDTTPQSRPLTQSQMRKLNETKMRRNLPSSDAEVIVLGKEDILNDESQFKHPGQFLLGLGIIAIIIITWLALPPMIAYTLCGIVMIPLFFVAMAYALPLAAKML